MRTTILTLTLAAGLCASIPATALASGTPTSSGRSGQTTWHLVVKPSGQRILGNTYLEADNVSRHGKPFGLDILTCPGAAQAGVAVAHCTLDLGTKGGTVRGILRLDNSTSAVTGRVSGGTGRFAGAKGTITGQGQQSGALLTVVLKGS